MEFTVAKLTSITSILINKILISQKKTNENSLHNLSLKQEGRVTVQDYEWKRMSVWNEIWSEDEDHNGEVS